MASGSAEDSISGQTAALPPPPLLPQLPPLSSSSRLGFRTPTLHHVEDIRTYIPGGHHPVNLGDVIGGKFKVINKLGNGGFAIVWLARNLEQHEYVVLRILRADASDREARILKHLKDPHGAIKFQNSTKYSRFMG